MPSHLRRATGISALLAVACLAVPAADAPLAVPDEAAQAQALKTIKEVYKADYARRRPEDRQLLARTLLDRAKDSGDDPAARYVFLHEACDQAAKGGDATLVDEALKALAAGFQIKPREERLKALATAGANVANAEAAQVVDEAQLALAQEAIDDDDFALAGKAARDAEQLARSLKDSRQATRARAMADRARTLADDYKQVSEVFDLLGDVSADGHVRLGTFYCFSKDDWSKGLAHLAAGSDEALKGLASAEAAAAAIPLARATPAIAPAPAGPLATDVNSPTPPPADPKVPAAATAAAEAALKVADGWWDYAQKQRGDTKEAILAHAVGWYRRAASSQTGAARAKLDKRLDEIERLLANSRHALLRFPPGAALLLSFEHESLALQGGKLAGVFDVSGHGLRGVVTGGATPVAGAFGTALAFDGTAQIDFGDPKDLQITGSQTIAFWIDPAVLDKRRNPFAKAFGGEGTMTLEINGGINYFYGTAGGNDDPYMACESSPIPAKQWTHMVVVRDLAAKKVVWFVNGKRDNESAAKYPAAVASNQPLLVGNGYTHPFIGQLDDFGIWPRALSETEIAQLYAAGAVGRR
jgi:hypothetical protein